jgi:hypothetical protein
MGGLEKGLTLSGIGIVVVARRSQRRETSSNLVSRSMENCEHEWELYNDGWYFTLSVCKKCKAMMEEDSTGVRILPKEPNGQGMDSGSSSTGSA